MNAFSFFRTPKIAPIAASVRPSGFAVLAALALVSVSMGTTLATASATGLANNQGYPVTAGKQTVWSSNAPAAMGTPLSVATVTPPSVSPGGKGDYPTTIGKRTVWASEVPAVTSAIVVGIAKDDCVGGRFVTEGKATRWAAVCSRCVTGTEVAGAGGKSTSSTIPIRRCTVSRIACSSETKMTTSARMSLCCRK